MKEMKSFCDKCRNETTYKINCVQLEGVLKGEKYSYKGKTAYCTACGSEIYTGEINDYNLKALYDVYREKNGIITLDKIQAIPNMYSIGKRPLSILLGWGEQTFTRYCDGDIPTKQYSEILQKIYEDPHYYDEILENNKEKLKSIKTYEKSKKAVNMLIRDDLGQKTKIDLTIEYLLNQCEDITPLALQKALYYIQGFYYAFYNKFIFNEDCEAWIHGPVYRDIYYRYRNYHFDAIKGSQEFDSSIFSDEEKSIFDSVIRNICCYSGKILEIFTHAEEPWLEARGDLLINVGSDKIIDKKTIGKYFIYVKEKYNMISPADIKDYAQQMFAKI